MNLAKKGVIFCAVWISVSACAWGQFMHRGPQAPKMPTPFQPVVGSGAEYQVTAKGTTSNFTYAVVGKEQVEGKEGYWLEIRIDNSKGKGEMVMKELTVMNGSRPDIKRLITQPPGHAPMEMPSSMLGMIKSHSQAAENSGDMGEKIGDESITVPAGTFECEHYRKKENGETVDFWISKKVSPYGVVKMNKSDASVVLEKVLTNETSHIKGKPQEIQMPHF